MKTKMVENCADPNNLWLNLQICCRSCMGEYGFIQL